VAAAGDSGQDTNREAHRESVREAGLARAIALSLAPEALGVLRLVRVEQADWHEAVRRESDGQPITGMLARAFGGWVHPISQPVTSIGRGLQNDMVLLDPAVSREHARLVLTREGWWIENVSERNELRLGGAEVPTGCHARIYPGESIALGNTTVQLLAPRSSARDIAPPGVRPIERDDADPLVPLCARDDAANGDAARGRTTTAITALQLDRTNLLSPGVTLQFAISGKLGPRARWLLAGGALFVFLLFALLTLGLAALIGQSAARDGLADKRGPLAGRQAGTLHVLVQLL
jgi:pSer/pThr/pTyr-binding forkhead associated (FHA) protein